MIKFQNVGFILASVVIINNCIGKSYESNCIPIETICDSSDKETSQMAEKSLPVVIIDPGTEYRGASRPFQGIPSIACAADGTLFATWFGGGHGETMQNYVVLVRSRDGGKTWSDELLVIEPGDNKRAFDPTIWVDPFNRLWLYWAQSHGRWWDGRGGVWALCIPEPQKDPLRYTCPKRFADGVMLNKPVIIDNLWFYPVAMWSPQSKSQFINHPNIPIQWYRSNVYISSDHGCTWQYQGGADVPERDHDENMIISLGDEKLWMLVRTKYGIGQSFSDDLGKTWTKGEPSAIKNPTARFHISRLDSDNLLLVKNGPIDERTDRCCMTAYISTDDGKTWPYNLIIDSREAVSYPDAAQDSQGRIYIIYDRDRYFAKEILMASITEEDITAGKIIDPASKLKLLVNKASGGPAEVSITPKGGIYQEPIEVRLSYPVHGPWIYYTLDNTVPTRQSKHYPADHSEPIIISSSATLKAKAIGGPGGQHQSPVSKAVFEMKREE